jgi:L-galactono-1,4-lactone dehydrogenase
MEQLLDGIERRNIPAHAPIEQRWSASSSSYMSPAYGPSDGLHSWVGIINYLPSTSDGGTTTTPEQEMLQRQSITALFTGPYCDLMRQVGKEVNATSHWAKLEVPKSLWDLIDLQLFLNTRFPLDQFNAWREQLDPKNLLASPLLNRLLGKPKT